MKTMVAGLAAAAFSLAAGGQGGEEPLTCAAIRFFRPASATTTIEGVCEVRLPALLRSVSQAARYRVDLVVRDSAGLELQRSDWVHEVPASVARTRGATVIESFSVSAAPGRYRVRVTLTPISGEPLERDMAVEAYRSAPAMSDLLLATAARQPASDSETPGPGEVYRAGLVMRTAPVPKLTPNDASLSWHAEYYARPGGPATGQFHTEVVAADGRRIIGSAERPVTIGEAGGLTRGSLDLTGLPEGQYRLRVALRLSDTTLTGEAPFAMAALATVTQTAQAEPGEAQDLFSDGNEAQLDSLFTPLVYLADSPRDRGLYRGLTVDGKRRFLRQFWAQRDPTPGTPANEARDEFHRGVAHANAAFHESGSANIPGWNTDRGRIYLKNGRPSETLPRPAASPRPFEVWRYSRDRGRWYVFMDETGFGHYVLIGTNDRREVGRGNWERILGADGTREAYQFLNLDVRALQANP